MPRIKGAVNILVRVDIAGGEKYYFPRTWWDSLGTKATGNERDKVVTVWAIGMQSAGWTAEKIYANRDTITDNTDARRIFKTTIATILPRLSSNGNGVSAPEAQPEPTNGVAPNAAHTTQNAQPQQPAQPTSWEDMTQEERVRMLQDAVPPEAKIEKTFPKEAPAIIKKAAPKFPYGKDLLNKLIDFANEVRSKQQKDPDNTRYTLSMRSMIKIAEDVTLCGVPVRQSLEDNVLSVARLVGDEEEYKALVTLVNARFTPDKPEDIEALELLALGPALPDVLPPGVPARTSPFQTDEYYFYGMLRQRPAATDGAKLKGIFVDGDPKLKIVARRFAVGKRPLAFCGPAGCGKTEFAVYLGTEAGLHVHIQSHDAHMEVEDVLGKYGETGDPNHPIGFFDGPLTQSVDKGWVYVADEETTVRAGVSMVYQEIKNGGDLPVRTASGARVVKRNQNFRYIGTFNPWTTYVGSNEMNLAQVERAYLTQWDYAPKAKETEILLKNFPMFAGK